MRKKTLAFLAVALTTGSAMAATPTTWTTVIDPTIYGGDTGTITFNDWGYKGPTGVGVNDFQVGAGFDSSRIGQIQHVITTSPDWLTRDPSYNAVADLYSNINYPNANMDGNVNFYKWVYTTPTSTFNNMQIDKAGNYHVARNDMAFGFYQTFLYKNGANAVQTIDSNINFQPYAISDAKGWCGSVLNANPNGVADMAGQVTFNFAFDAFIDNNSLATGGFPATQIVPGFVMRSYGDYVVDVRTEGNPAASIPGDLMHFSSTAVGNNTNPLTGALDPAYHNKVSFHGAGVVPAGVWVFNEGIPSLLTVADTQGAAGAFDGEARGDGATWHVNGFAGYAFILRADADRTVEFISPTGHSDYITTDPAAYASLAAVPVPAAVWLLGSGLLGLAGVARRRPK